MARNMPVIFVMLALVIVFSAILGIASYYGTSDWQWIVQQNARLLLLLMVMSVAFVALVGYLKRR